MEEMNLILSYNRKIPESAKKEWEKFKGPTKRPKEGPLFLKRSDKGRDSQKELVGDDNEIPCPTSPSKYSPTQLKKLVKLIQKYTLLSYLRPEDWTSETLKNIEHFITYDEPLLTIFYDKNILCAKFKFTRVQCSDIMYFMRMDRETILTTSNFKDIVLFGSLGPHCEASILQILKYVYLPRALNLGPEFPRDIKRNVCQHTTEFLAELGGIVNKMSGLVGFDVPSLGILKVHEDSNGFNVTSSLARVVAIWNKYLISFIEDQIQFRYCKDFWGLVDIWSCRLENVYYIRAKLQEKQTSHILEIIFKSEKEHNSFLEFEENIKDLTWLKEEASSNIVYLTVCCEPCQNLKELCHLDHPVPYNTIMEQLMRLFSAVAFVWLESPYYNTCEKLTQLCKTLKGHYIHFCREFINAEEIFRNFPKRALERLKTVITLNDNYNDLYYMFTSRHNKRYPERLWKLECPIEEVLLETKMFNDRCNDMIEVCNTMISYGRFDETFSVPEPTYCKHTIGIYHAKLFTELEFSYLKALWRLTPFQDAAFKLDTMDWLEAMTNFRDDIKIIEWIASTTVAETFSTISNIEEGINELYKYRQYIENSHNPKFLGIIRTLYEMIQTKIEKYINDVENERLDMSLHLPTYSGTVMLREMRTQWIQMSLTVVAEAGFLELDKQLIYLREKALETFNMLCDKMSNIYIKNTEEWLNPIENINRLYMKPLFKHLPMGLIQLNFDWVVEYIRQDAENLNAIGYAVPYSLGTISNKHPQFTLYLKTSMSVVWRYNIIFEGLRGILAILFEKRIKEIKLQMNKFFRELEWTSYKTAVPLLTKTLRSLHCAQMRINKYKACSESIMELCETISKTLVVDSPEICQYKWEEFWNRYENIRAKAVHEIRKNIEKIAKYAHCALRTSRGRAIKKTSEDTESHHIGLSRRRILFIKEIESQIEQAVLENIKTCYIKFLDSFIGPGKTGPQFSIEISLTLKSLSICHDPPVHYVAWYVKNLFRKAIVGLNTIKRLHTIFGISYEQVMPFGTTYGSICMVNPFCCSCQSIIDEAIPSFVLPASEMLPPWEKFEEIWRVPKINLMSYYNRTDASIERMKHDLTKYKNLAMEIRRVPLVSTHGFLKVDADSLSQIILKHCDLWCEKISKYVYYTIVVEMGVIRKDISDKKMRLMVPATTMKEVPIAQSIHREILNEMKDLGDRTRSLKYKLVQLVEIREDFPDFVRQEIECLNKDWETLMITIKEEAVRMRNMKVQFQKDLKSEMEEVEKLAKESMHQLLITGPRDSPLTKTGVNNKVLKMSLKKLDVFHERYMFFLKTADSIEERLENLSLPRLPNYYLVLFHNEYVIFKDTWDLFLEAKYLVDGNKSSSISSINTDDLDRKANQLIKRFNDLPEKADRSWGVMVATNFFLDNVKLAVELIVALTNKAMEKHHLDKIRKYYRKLRFKEAGDINIVQLIYNGPCEDSHEMFDVCTCAIMELGIRNQFDRLTDTWNTVGVEVVSQKGDRSGVYRLMGFDDIGLTIEDSQTILSSLKSNRYIAPFMVKVERWDKHLRLINDVLEYVLGLQRLFMYMENIFSAEDVRVQLSSDSATFEKLVGDWGGITCELKKNNNIFKFATAPGRLKSLKTMTEVLENIERNLEEYLELKRHRFPRFYFISNDDLLDILGNAATPTKIQTYFKKLFDNVTKVKMVPHPTVGSTDPKMVRYEGVGMYSAEGEYIPWPKSIDLRGAVETWLNEIEDVMRMALRINLIIVKKSLKNFRHREKWVTKYPGQLCITSSQMEWTSSVTLALRCSSHLNDTAPLRAMKKKQNKVLKNFSDAIRGELSSLQRAKVVALVTIEIHARDVIENMSNREEIKGEESFEWLAQLRFYLDKELKICIVRQTNTMFKYGYEYLGNSGRLVITPLTDRCYITLTTALSLHRGGSPKGPAGTGKTETVKDLGKGLAYYVIVINCSEGLDYKSMGRMFSGLAQAGAWGCFDEFNRINIEVLSVVAQQILAIVAALSAGLVEFFFENWNIRLIHTCGVFITMNPGYAGRTELPDNLKSMFRPISMMVPDTGLIAEITLFGEGFLNTRSLAKKVFTLFSLAKQQLSKQDHYDFGLRGMVALLRYAGKKRRQHPELNSPEVLLLAMRDMNLAKLTSDDLPLFNGITDDLFPSIVLAPIDQSMMFDVIRQELKKMNLEDIEIALSKVIQLYETKGSRHSVMIVGASGAAKSRTWQVLQATAANLKGKGVKGFEIAKEYVINPKSVTLDELYGAYNLATGEWLDGILSCIMRSTCSDESKEEKWIIFDGPVDAVWIENMNSVMDDNKILTLVNSERIAMPPQVSLLFEVEDLKVASPATVSRCGMVFNDYKDFGWRPFVDSWLKSQEHKLYRTQMKNNFDTFLDEVLEYKRSNCVEIVPLPELCGVASLCKLLSCLAPPENCVPNDPTDIDAFKLLAKLWFVFCMIWSVCAVVNEKGREKMDMLIRDMEPNIFPMANTIYEYYVNQTTQSFETWEKKIDKSWSYPQDSPFYKLIVPTVDTVRYQYFIKNLLETKTPVLLVGVVGTGKSSTAYSVLDSLDASRFSRLVINMSAQTTSKNLQDTIESKVEKRAKGIFYPVGGKTMIVYMDDLNMPAKEVYGAQPPLELLRQWIDYSFWYNRKTQQVVRIVNILLMAAMGPPGGGRNSISNRILSRFSVINMTFPADAQIMRIFSYLLSNRLALRSDLPQIGSEVTKMTIALYSAVSEKMLPTPQKMHYLFTLRDISKVFQGLLRYNIDGPGGKADFLRLWIHESYRVFHDRLIDESERLWFHKRLDYELGVHFNKTFTEICPQKRVPLFCDFRSSTKIKIYNEVTEFEELRVYMDNRLDRYNNTRGNIRMDLVIFEDAMEHVCRIARVISQPRGNVLAVGIGGSGRQSLSKLASYLCSYNIFQIELTGSYHMIEFKEDLKKLYGMSGVKNQPTSFLFCDNQVAEEAFLEIINNVLSTGEVSNLYKPDEFEEIESKLFDALKDAWIEPSKENTYAFLIERVRANLHIILCMSPIGNEFRVRLRQYPSLIGCTTIDWVLDWPKVALLEVANYYLQEVDMLMQFPKIGEATEEVHIRSNQNVLVQTAAAACAVIHDSVARSSKEMLRELKRYNYVTPTNYLELVAGYKNMLSEKRIEILGEANKLNNGLFKINESQITVKIMKLELSKATISVSAMDVECDEFIVLLQEKKTMTNQKASEVAAQSLKIGKQEKQCQALADVALKDLNAAMPALNAAVLALDALNKKDLTEIKSYTQPPEKVLMVLEAVMILKSCEPTWVQAKKELGDVNFLSKLKNFDKDNIKDETLIAVKNYTSRKEFNPNVVGAVSRAAMSLAMWVIAIEKYARILKIVAPKRIALNQAMASLKKKQQQLADAQENLNNLNNLLEQLQNEYEAKQQLKDDLKKRADKLARNIHTANLLMTGLGDERIRWTKSISDYNEQFNHLLGDCLLATAFISYMGPFVTRYRDQLMGIWITAMPTSGALQCSGNFEVTSFLSTPTTIREWNINGLPSDLFSTQNGLIVTRGSRWPLIIDPQVQAWTWINKMESPNGLSVVDFGERNYMEVIQKAMRVGRPVLLQNVTDVLEPSIKPILNKGIIKEGRQLYIQVGDRLLEYNLNFKFFITTKLGNPHYPPEISTKTTLVNFCIKQEGLEDQLLGLIIRIEKPELEELKDNLVLNIAKGRRTLKELEDELLRILNESKGSLLENEELIDTLNSSKLTSLKVTEQLETAITTEREIDLAREVYRESARMGAIIFFILNDLPNIDPMYQFSLESYNEIFMGSVTKSDPDLYNISQRVNNINSYHMYSVYKNTCRGLFERHKLLFSFYMCVKIMEADKKLNAAEYNFLLKGGVVLNREEQLNNPCENWLPPGIWDNITELEKLPDFDEIAESFEYFQDEWRAWYYNKNPEKLPLVDELEDICNEFQRMLVVRAIRPDRVPFSITRYVSFTLGERYTEPPVLDIKEVLEDSSSKTPLIFVLSPGVDPTKSLIQLAESSGMAENFHSLSLGQGQAPIATSMIERGIYAGDWVFLANCHLSLSWMPTLDKIVQVNRGNNKLHENFRLWLSSSPHPDFPISILQSALKMTTEPPKGLRANMKRLMSTMDEEKASICKQQEKYKKLLFALCFFHSVLIERKKFQQLGWNVDYSFNDADFEISENILRIYLDEYDETPWDALKFLVADICYGGHVTDDWDRRLMSTYVASYFNDDAIFIPNYKLSSLPTYFIPSGGLSIGYFLRYVNKLPVFDEPQAFGQHSNADITSLVIETRVLCENLMSLQVEDTSTAGTSAEETVMQMVGDILVNIPKVMNYEKTLKMIGPMKKPLQVVLLQEMYRYNYLLSTVKQSLIDLQKGIEGLVVMSEDLEEIFKCINDGRVPSTWLKAYPSLKTLGSWTRDLVYRVEHFNVWAETNVTPVTFWLSAYTFPTGLLTAVLQTSSRKLKIPIDLLEWEFTPLKLSPDTAMLAPPKNGIYVRGTYLEAAGWNLNQCRLCEPKPMQLVCLMPIILFLPCLRDTKKSPLELYICPLYTYPQRSGTQGREAFVVAVKLPSGLEPSSHWTKRGTALLLSLSD